MFLKVAPIKEVVCFAKKRKLRLRFVRPFETLERVGDLAYRLALPPRFAAVHNYFHVSMLRKYVHELSQIINYTALEVNKDLTYEEMLKIILEKKIHKLRNKDVTLIKVQWSHHRKDGATWEQEDKIRIKYPTFFDLDKF